MPRGPPNAQFGLRSQDLQNRTARLAPLAAYGYAQHVPLTSEILPWDAQRAQQEAMALANTNANRLVVAQQLLHETNGWFAILANRPDVAAHIISLLDRAMSILTPMNQSSTPQEDTGICVCLNTYNARVHQASRTGLLIQTPGIRMLTNITQQHFVDTETKLEASLASRDYAAAEKYCAKLSRMETAYEHFVPQDDWRLAKVNVAREKVANTQAFLQPIHNLRQVAAAVSNPHFQQCNDEHRTTQYQQLLTGFTSLTRQVPSMEQIPSDLRKIVNDGSIIWNPQTRSYIFGDAPITYIAPGQ